MESNTYSVQHCCMLMWVTSEITNGWYHNRQRSLVQFYDHCIVVKYEVEINTGCYFNRCNDKIKYFVINAQLLITVPARKREKLHTFIAYFAPTNCICVLDQYLD